MRVVLAHSAVGGGKCLYLAEVLRYILLSVDSNPVNKYEAAHPPPFLSPVGKRRGNQ